MSVELDRELTEQERFPLLTPAGKQLLNRITEHKCAPRWTHRCGDRLNEVSLERVKEFEKQLRASKVGWQKNEIPDWVSTFAQHCVEQVPIYRSRAFSQNNFRNLPTVSREDIGREPWSFVPDDQPLDDLIYYGTSGTTGHPIKVLSHPEVSSKYICLLKAALALHGVTLDGGADRVAILLVCAQNYTYTYASVSSFLDQAGFAKINLNPLEWADPEDRVKFIDDLNPEIFTGDPVSFFELAKLPLKTKPKALVSSSMALLPAWKDYLQEHFGCPVIDLYSSNECRLMAASVPAGHVIVPHDLYVEILDEHDQPCDENIRGEITITCPRNPFLPLLRYRTGDYASIKYTQGAPILQGLEGRPPTLFVTMDGKVLNNVDVSFMLYAFPLAQYSLHQNSDRSLVFRMNGSVTEQEIVAVIKKLFGDNQTISFAPLSDAEDTFGDGRKITQYTTDVKNIDLAKANRAFQRMTWDPSKAR